MFSRALRRMCAPAPHFQISSGATGYSYTISSTGWSKNEKNIDISKFVRLHNTMIDLRTLKLRHGEIELHMSILVLKYLRYLSCSLAFLIAV